MRVWLRACLAGLLLAPQRRADRPSISGKGLQVLDVSTGWFDAGLVNGQNKLVPTISFKLKNISDQKLSVLQVNVLFKQINDPKEWGNGFLTVVGSSGLAPGATTEMLTIKSNLGLHRLGSDTAGHAEERPFRRREGRVLRQVRIDAVGAARRLSRDSPVDHQLAR